MPNIIRLIYPSRQEPVLDNTQRPEQVTESRWHQPWSEPVRQRIAPTLAIALFTSGLIAPVLNPNTQITNNFESRWHQPWSEPVRVKPALPAGEQQFLSFVPTVSETITVDKWFEPFSEPRRFKVTINPAQQQFLAFVKSDPFPETTTIDRYWQPFAEPIRQKQGLAVYEQRPTFWSHFTPEIITADKWLYPLSEPVRKKSGLEANKQQFFAIDPFSLTQPETVSEDRWHEPWSEPVRHRLGRSVSLQPSIASAPFVQESITEDKWHFPWSEPVRLKPGLASYQQQFLAFVKSDPFPESTTIDRYLQPLSLPVRLRAAQQQLLIYPPVTVETITPDKWFIPLSDPVRTKSGLLASEQQFLALVKSDPFPESTTVDRYWQPLSEPVRRRLAQQQQTIAFYDRPIPPFNWFTQSLDPTRRIRGPQYQQVLANPIVSAEVITLDKWLYQLSEPRRSRLGLLASEQQSLAFTQIISVPIDRWLQSLSIPQRLNKSGLLTSEQPFFTTSSLPPPVLASQWLYDLNEPVRIRQGLRASLQTTTAWPPQVIANIVTLVMSATETGQDTALFSIRLFQPAVSARVSIVEIPVGSGSLFSIRES